HGRTPAAAPHRSARHLAAGDRAAGALPERAMASALLRLLGRVWRPGAYHHTGRDLWWAERGGACTIRAVVRRNRGDDQGLRAETLHRRWRPEQVCRQPRGGWQLDPGCHALPAARP